MPHITVNLTTTESRQKFCIQTILSLTQQTITPDKIRVWISREPYLRDTGINTEPNWVTDLNKIKNIIEICWTKNTGPYRKLIPALKSADDDDIIITADDDIIYGETWLESLLLASKENPDMIIAARVKKITRNFLGIQKSYMQWPIITEDSILKKDFIVTHGGGTLFKKKFIRRDLLDNENFISVCPTTDDLWFSMLANKSASDIYVCTAALKELFFISHDDGLVGHNTLITSKKIAEKIYQKTILNIFGIIGFNICGNDHSHKKIKDYSNTLKQTLRQNRSNITN
jgi:glycosyltransferase involved in cell wall biosynthesis